MEGRGLGPVRPVFKSNDGYYRNVPTLPELLFRLRNFSKVLELYIHVYMDTRRGTMMYTVRLIWLLPILLEQQYATFN
jgi:hypothetical protein